jgi:leader peptidase (prepilin peptidase)/N-methyltransferase
MLWWLGLGIYSIFMGILMVSIICRESVYHQESKPNIANTKFCYKKNSFIYKIVELSTFLVIFSIFYFYGFNSSSIILSIVFSLLLALSVIDIKYKEVPDYINLMALTLAFFSRDFLDAFSDALIIAGAVALFRFYVSFIIKKESLGEGDIIIAGTIGAILGVELSLFALFLSASLALPFSIYARNRHEPELPFIPFLSIATYITYLFSSEVSGFIEYLYS